MCYHFFLLNFRKITLDFFFAGYRADLGLSPIRNVRRQAHNVKHPVTYGYISTHHRMIFLVKQSPMCNFLYDHNRNKAPHLHVFTLIFTHFKWSKPGLKRNFEPFFFPINQDFLENCQYIAVAAEKYFNHKQNSP